jgi:hypothetical protein
MGQAMKAKASAEAETESSLAERAEITVPVPSVNIIGGRQLLARTCICSHEIIDGLQRQYFPKEFQNIEYVGARPDTVKD